jgi:drug/metabolite transporter (DMT)-like permease
LTAAVLASRNNNAIAAGLVCAITFWGANNVGVKFLVREWPPFWIGCSRMVAVAAVLMAVLRWTRWLGEYVPVTPELSRVLWGRAGLSLAFYVTLFTVSLRFTSASHVALYLGTSPVWALLWEGGPKASWDSARRYGAALLALSGLGVLFWPKLQAGGGDWRGDLLAISASITWTFYGRQCRVLGVTLSGAEITAHTMWRAAVWLAPFAAWEVLSQGLVWNWRLAGIQTYCIFFGGVISFALYNNALRHWPISQVFMFGNLIPVSTMAWAWLLLGEPVTATFGVAMLLVVAGVVLGQGHWLRALGNRWLPSE